jgi:hypothetical protein
MIYIPVTASVHLSLRSWTCVYVEDSVSEFVIGQNGVATWRCEDDYKWYRKINDCHIHSACSESARPWKCGRVDRTWRTQTWPAAPRSPPPARARAVTGTHWTWRQRECTKCTKCTSTKCTKCTSTKCTKCTSTKPLQQQQHHTPPKKMGAGASRSSKQTVDALADAKRQVQTLTFLRHVETQARRRLVQTAETGRPATCAICISNLACVACVPCGHMCMCFECTHLFLANLKDRAPCPICRKDIHDLQRIYTVANEPLDHADVRVGASRFATTWA